MEGRRLLSPWACLAFPFFFLLVLILIVEGDDCNVMVESAGERAIFSWHKFVLMLSLMASFEYDWYDRKP